MANAMLLVNVPLIIIRAPMSPSQRQDYLNKWQIWYCFHENDDAFSFIFSFSDLSVMAPLYHFYRYFDLSLCVLGRTMIAFTHIRWYHDKPKLQSRQRRLFFLFSKSNSYWWNIQFVYLWLCHLARSHKKYRNKTICICRCGAAGGG